MTISTKLQHFRNSTRITINDKFMGDQGASQLSQFLLSHTHVQSLQIKSNDISPQGFLMIFSSLTKNPTLKSLNIEHNNLGINDYIQWHDQLSNMLLSCQKLERLNISNNKITSEGFDKLIYGIVNAKNLKLVELRYNDISSEQIEQLINQLQTYGNQSLLYIQLAGNKIKRQTLDKLQAILSQNRRKNPTTKQKILNLVPYHDQNTQQDITSKTFQRSNTIDQIPKQEIPRYLEDILDQTRRYAAENKVRLQQQLLQLQKKQKLDVGQLTTIQNKCNQLIIINRNIKFQLQRTLSQTQQLHHDQQNHFRTHQQKLRQTTKQLQNLQLKYQQIQNHMNKQHQLKMKQIKRNWQNKLHVLQQKIRTTENQNNLLQIQIKKNMEKKQIIKFEFLDQQNIIKNKINDQEISRFNLKMINLDAKIHQLEDQKKCNINYNKQLIHQLEKCQLENKKLIQELQVELMDLKAKQLEFNAKSKDFFNKNQKIKSQVQMKQITINKLLDQLHHLNTQIQQTHNKQQQQLEKTRLNYQFTRITKNQDKKSRLQKLNQLENNLRLAQMESNKLRQQYGLLAQKLQVNIGLAVHKVFTQNSLY